tara:strand:+ start:2841 stop:4103 length:1263 start_codon:yes stop_codon:yes gene_type:complete
MAKELLKKFDKTRVKAEKMYRKKLNSLLDIDSDPLTDPEVMRSAQASADNEREQGLLQQQRNMDAQRMAAERQATRLSKTAKDIEKQMDAAETRRRDQEAASMFKRQPLSEGGKFPDLTGDGKVTQADVLKGRGVFNEGSLLVAREKYGLGSKVTKLAKNLLSGKSRFNKKTEEEQKVLFDNIENISDKELDEVMSSVYIAPQEAKVLNSKFKGNFDDRTYGDLSKAQLEYLFSTYPSGPFREPKAEGSMMMPEEGMPVDTYPNIPADEMDEAIESQLPDAEMEENYISYIMEESLNDDEQDYLVNVLQKDPRLSDILDKVITVASEFSGAGEVEGPGTGVSDSIPARLSDGEFVFTKKATDQLGADQLQVMMDDAERAYDGGVMMAEGGMMDEEDLGMSKTKEEIEKLMMGANRMPSIR